MFNRGTYHNCMQVKSKHQVLKDYYSKGYSKLVFNCYTLHNTY